MQRRWRFVAALVVALPALTPSATPATATAIRSGSVTGWVPYWEATEGTEALQAAAGFGLFSEVMPFWYSAVDATTVRTVGTTANLLSVTRAARAKGLLVIPSITDGTGKLALQAILTDPTSRSAHVQRLVTLVMNGIDGISYDGIDLDYEGFAFADGKATWPQTQPVWLAFVQELSTALHAQGKLLSVTVPPMWDDGKAGYSVYYPTGSWASLTAAVDRLRLMVYDWSVASPGPIAPLSWVNNVISYVQKMVPASDLGKVWLGVPAYGRSWARITGECPAVLPTGVSRSTTSVESESGATLAATHNATASRVEGETTFSWVVGTYTGLKSVTPTPDPYAPTGTVANEIPKASEGALVPAVRIRASTVNVTCTITRVVYVPDNQSIVERSQIAQAAGLGGVVIWALGYESNDLWSTLASS